MHAAIYIYNKVTPRPGPSRTRARGGGTWACLCACAVALLVRADEPPAPLLEGDAAALRELQHAWAPEGWEPGVPPCAWPGVRCAEVDVEGLSFFSGRQKRNVVRAITLRNVCQFAPEDHVCEVPPTIGQLQYVSLTVPSGGSWVRARLFA
eukprot:Tamp_08035.p2 GENE.Tamp_08035~~Tamp_08035.p2  ORF type:complete len:164 (-),score=15.07 Tamp_08035:1899-2351(-)